MKLVAVIIELLLTFAASGVIYGSSNLRKTQPPLTRPPLTKPPLKNSPTDPPAPNRDDPKRCATNDPRCGDSKKPEYTLYVANKCDDDTTKVSIYLGMNPIKSFTENMAPNECQLFTRVKAGTPIKYWDSGTGRWWPKNCETNSNKNACNLDDMPENACVITTYCN